MPNIAGNLPLLDVFAFSWFVSCWVGYTYYSSCGSLKRKSLLAAMDQYREEWALSILSRDNRIVDSQVINGLIRKETFFASTTVLILVGVITQIGSYEKYALISSELSFAEPPSAMLWLLKIAEMTALCLHISVTLEATMVSTACRPSKIVGSSFNGERRKNR